jgi:outer membrane protein OmpA-like peptidoglycan-associated protein/Tol biopolymer transport system component
MEKYRFMELDKAKELLRQAIEKDKEFADANLLLGNIESMQGNEKAALICYQQIILNNKSYSDAYFYASQSALVTGEYTLAKEYIDIYLNTKGLSKTRLERCRTVKLSAEFALDQLKHPQPFEPINLGPNINTPNKDYFPSLTVDGQKLIFDRNINNKEDFYISQKTATGWSVGVNPGAPLNTEDNESYPTFTADGQYVFYVRCGARPDGGSCDIYFARFDGNTWESPKNLGPPVNTGAFESQPCISPDGRTLYFVSNRPGGMGGTDIWKSNYINGKWSSPINLGPTINTPGEDAAPFIHPDGQTLYFVSEGRIGMGNLDIYISRMDKDGNWGGAENLGYPINTFAEERSLMVGANGVDAFLTSGNLKGFGDWDIYTFKMPEGKRPVTTTYVKGRVFDAVTKAPLAAAVELIDLSTGKQAYFTYSNKNTGEMLACLKTGVNYAFHVSGDGYLFFSENYSFKDKGDAINPIVKDIPLKKIDKDDKVILKNVFFETGKYDLRPESFSELDKLVELLKLNPKINIEVSGHTDNVGKKQDNLTLSQNRAKSVNDYLVSKGIVQTRLAYKGYGDAKPEVANDTDEHRQLNRRTEFKITSL